MIWLLSNAKARANRARHRRRRLWGRSFDRTRKRSLRERRIVILPGQYLDEETGLHYNYFRDYDPVTGRYVQSDPIGLNGGLNRYLYASGNSLANIDPSGLFVGAALRKLFELVGKRPEEAAYVAQLIDVGIGAVAGDLPGCIGDFDIRTPLDLLRAYGGSQAITLSTATTYGLYGAGATASSATATVLLPIALAGYGGVEIGRSLNRLYERYRGASLGSDLYDLFH